MISVGPVPPFADLPGEIGYPIARDVDANMYERQHGGDTQVGSYAHWPIIVGPDDVPSIEDAVLSPTEMLFTRDDFEPQLLQAVELMADLLGDERASNRYVINGLISMALDDPPALSETPEVAGLWSVTASSIKVGLGIGGAVAEWMATCREVEPGGVTVLASRISCVTGLGWELYVPMVEGGRFWDTIWDAGQPHSLIPVGIGVYGTTARLEKGYRAFGAELDASCNLVGAAMTRPSVKEQSFVGKDAYLAQHDVPPCAVLCTLTVDDHRPASGQLRYLRGSEPILTASGEPLVGAKGRPSYATSGGSAPSVGNLLLMTYLLAAQAVAGARLAVEYQGEQYLVTVAMAGSTPLFDPENERVRG